MTEIEGKLDHYSSMHLDVTKWEMTQELKKIQRSLDATTKTFTSHDDFINIFQDLQSGITELIHIYEMIQSYQEQRQLVNYIGNISKTLAQDSTLNELKNNPDLRELQSIILSNVIIERYFKVRSAVRQWAFPFEDNYVDADGVRNIFDAQKTILAPPTTEPATEQATEPGKDVDKANFDLLLHTAIDGIKVMKKNVDGDMTTSKECIDGVLFTGEFGRHPLEPFYEWNALNAKSKIQDLFTMEKGSDGLSDEIVFSALFAQPLDDIKNVHYYNHRELVKFKSINFAISHTVPEQNELLQRCLSNFYINLTHSADSYFAYQNKIHVFSGNWNATTGAEFTFSYNVDKDGKMVINNNTVGKYDASRYTNLSPHTMWKVQLELVDPKDLSTSSYFETLQNFSVDDIIIQLKGIGTYVKTSHSERGTAIVHSGGV
eukprot:Awhi_evm1s4469